MNATMPALLVAVAFGIALASAPARSRTVGMIAFLVAAAVVAFAPIPAGWSEYVHLSCWIAIVTCAASVHFPYRNGVRASLVLAFAAGAASGAAVDLANAHAMLVSAALIATTACIASRVTAQRVPLAPKVVSSWLIAIALLAATLQIVPVTPGYLADHLE